MNTSLKNVDGIWYHIIYFKNYLIQKLPPYGIFRPNPGLESNKMSVLRGNTFYRRMIESLDCPPASAQGWIKEIQGALKHFVQINPLSFTCVSDFLKTRKCVTDQSMNGHGCWNMSLISIRPKKCVTRR